MTDHPENDTAPPAPPTHKRGCLKTISVLALVAVLLLGGGAWIARGWITTKAEAALHKELKKHHLHVTYDSARFSLRHGLVIKNLTLFRDAAHTQPFINLSNAAAAANLSGEISALITTDDASLTAYTGTNQPTLSNLDIRFRAGTDHLELETLTGTFQGLAIDAKGVVLLRKKTDQENENPETASEKDPPHESSPLDAIDLTPLDLIVKIADFKSDNGSPTLTVQFEHNAPANTRTATGSLSGTDFSWRALQIDSLEAPFKHVTTAEESYVDLKNLALTFEGRPLTLDARANLKDQALQIESLNSSVDLIALASQADPKTAASLKTLRFTTPPVITASGTVPVKALPQAELQIKIAGDNELQIDAKDKTIPLQNLAGNLTLKEGLLNTQDFTARLFGGSLKAATSLRPFDKPLTLDTTTVSIQKAVISQVETVIGLHKGIGGTLSANFTGSGQPSITGLNGNGHVQADGAEFYSIPIYGNLAELFGKILPTFDRNQTSALTADLQLNQGILSTNNLKIISSGTTITSESTVNFNSNTLRADADARLGGDGIVGMTTSLLGKALEIEAEGSFDHIKWRFKNVPGLDTFQNMAGLTGEIGKGTFDVLTGSAGTVLDVGKEVPGKAVEGAAEAVKGLFKGLIPKKDK